MTDSPKLRPYAVAMLFGQGGNVNLGLGIVGATDREHAGAHAVLIHARENNVTEPLIGITIMEIEDRVVRLMFNGLKPGEVVPLRTVEPEAPAPSLNQLNTGTPFPPPEGFAGLPADVSPQDEQIAKSMARQQENWNARFPQPNGALASEETVRSLNLANERNNPPEDGA